VGFLPDAALLFPQKFCCDKKLKESLEKNEIEEGAFVAGGRW